MTRSIGSKSKYYYAKLHVMGLCIFLSFISFSSIKVQNQDKTEIKEKVLLHWVGFAKALLYTDSVSLFTSSADSIYCPIFCESESILDAEESCFTFSKVAFFSKYFNVFPSDSLSSVITDMEKTKILIHPNGNKAEVLLTTQEPTQTNPGNQIVFHFQIEKDKIVLVAFDTIP